MAECFLGQTLIRVEPNKVEWVVRFVQKWNPPLQLRSKGSALFLKTCSWQF